MEKERSKVKILCAEKLFYDLLLKEWHSKIPGSNQAHQLKNALKNLRNYPLTIQGYAGLMHIKGVFSESVAIFLEKN